VRDAEYLEPLRRFVEERHLDGRAEVGDDTPLLEWGIIDSLALADLIAFAEERFGVSVPLEAVTPESFSSLRAIASLFATLAGDGT
jgi:acyl carrier protein